MHCEYRNARADTFAELREAFELTTKAYLDVLKLPLISAGNPYEDDAPPSRVLNAWGVEFKADFEAATEKALSDRGQPNLKLQEAFFAMLEGETVKPAVANQVIQRCGKVYRDRHITPGQYFRPPMRRGSLESRERAERAKRGQL